MNKWCVVFMCLLSLPAQEVRADPIQIYLMAGQSNMVGSGISSELPTEPFDYTEPQQVPFSYDLEIGAHVSNGFEFLRPSVRSGSFGSELTFGRRMDLATAGPIGIIKVAAGGTNLSHNWTSESPIPDRAMYPLMISHIQSTLAQSGIQGIDYVFAGLLWTQGESDTSDEGVAMYADNLTDFIQDVRTDLNAPDLPVYISRLSQFTNYKNRLLMRGAQSQVAQADPLVRVVDSDHLELRFDQIHYNSQGQMDLGHAFADAILFGPPPEDFNDDGIVTDDDLNILINHWDLSGPTGDADGDGFVSQADLKLVVDQVPAPPPPLDNADLTGEGFVGIDDLNILLTFWNQNVQQGDITMGDLNVDGFVGITDLTQLLTQWNTLVLDPALFIPTLQEMDLDGSGGISEGDLHFMFSQWSFLDQTAPMLPTGSENSPLASDFNADGVVDVEDLRYLLVELPAGLRISPADLDGDGFIGVNDLTRVLANWNQNVPPGDPMMGDVDGDGFVGIDDLNAVLADWNSGTPPPPGASSQVPEPAVGLVLLVPLLMRGRRSHTGVRASRRSSEPRKTPHVFFCSVLLLTLTTAEPAHATETVINQGTRDWVAAATAGRADMLILGDSIVNHGLGLAGGISNAAKTRLGLAGTGLAALGTSQLKYPGFGGAELSLSLDWIRSTYTLPVDLQGHAVSTKVTRLDTNAATPKFWLAMGFNDSLLDRSAGYNWQLWAASTNGADGSLSALRASRLQNPWTRTVLETSSAYTVPASTDSLSLIEIPFAPVPGEVSDWHEFSLLNTTRDTAILYNRLIDPNATGITVTGWSYPGGSMNDFVTDLYANTRRTQQGRADYLAALVAGNSGKLNVVIAMGDNDSGETEASLSQQITPGYSTEAYIDNVQTQIALVTSDWAAAGLPANDLSFSLTSNYQIGPELLGAERVARMAAYRLALRDLAATDPRFSFVDLWGASPTAEVAVANNYIHDGEHPSREGSLLYGALFMNELLETTPIPGDLDGDGFVGLNDLSLVLSNWNTEFDEPWILIEGPNDYRPDPTYDGFVGIDDLNIVLSNWNAGSPPGASANIPEPASVTAFLCFATGLVGKRRV